MDEILIDKVKNLSENEKIELRAILNSEIKGKSGTIGMSQIKI